MNKWCAWCTGETLFTAKDVSYYAPVGIHWCEIHPNVGAIRFKRPTRATIEDVKAAILELRNESKQH